MNNKPSTALEAVAFLTANPEFQKIGPKRLAKMDNVPHISYQTWKKARHMMQLPPVERYAPAKYKKYKPVTVEKPGDKTIVHINTALKTAHVIYNGQATGFKSLHDPIKLINVYRHRGYKYTWLNDTVILLTKRVRNSPKGTTA